MSVAKYYLTLLACLAFFPARAQKTLSLAEIMTGPEFIGHLPSQPSWSEDNKRIYFNWKPDSNQLDQPYVFDLVTGKTRLLTLEERQQPFNVRRIYNATRSKNVFIYQGDLFLQDQQAGKTLQITNTIARENNPVFSADGQYVVFEVDNNLYSWQLSTGSLRQLSQFMPTNKADEAKKTAQQSWLEADQLQEFEILRQRKTKEDSSKALREKLEVKRPKAIYLGKNRLSSADISPDLKYLHYRLSTPSAEKTTAVPNYVTLDGYTDDLSSRPKVGGKQNESSYWIYEVEGDTTFEIKTDQLPAIKRKAPFLRDYHSSTKAWVDSFDKARPVQFSAPVFSPNGRYTLLQIRSNDNKDRWLALVNPKNGQLQLIDHQYDSAWIAGPGINAFSMGFLGDEETVWFQSEKTGYSQLYLHHIPSGKTRALTTGNFEILQARLSNDKRSYYVHASKEGPFEIHFYRIVIQTAQWTKLSQRKGRHEVVLSPDERKMAVLYSYSNQPTELCWQNNTSSAALQPITQSTTAAFQAYTWRDPAIVFIPTRDGAQVPARLYEPTADKKNGAAIIFVHGAGYLQNVHYGWSQYYREFMFHNFLADQGYTVLDIDYRGSAGYGRDWRTAIYRHMGGMDLTDQVDGAKYLVAQKGIDATRLGIYGGSYGGFITLMALTTQPGVFAAGAALRSVTDWAHYNHGYTSNILNTPKEDSLAYHRSSPIYYAEGLQGQLLMLHGMVDVNVHYQDVVRMSQRFIELGKTNWDLAIYPMEDHGFVENSSWQDEYRRIYELFEKNLGTSERR